MLPSTNKDALQSIFAPQKQTPTDAEKAVSALAEKREPVVAAQTMTDVIGEQQAADTEQAAQLITETLPPAKPEPKMPFGALGTDANGIPYYGSGLKGWIRQTYADLFDPQKWQSDLKMTDTDRDNLDKFTGAAKVKIDNFLTPLKEMGLDIESMSGLSSEEMATAWTDLVTVEVAASKGMNPVGYEIKNGLRMMKDFSQRTAWGLLELMGLDYVMRTATATNVAAREFAEDYNKKESPIPQIFDVELVSMATGRLTQAYHMATVAKALVKGDLQWSEWKETVKSYRDGAEMAYTMALQTGAVDEFKKQLATGKDAGLIARDLQNPLTELAGSIIGDPTTYLGMGIPTLAKTGKAGQVLETAKFLGMKLPWRIAGRIPEFGEIIAPAVKLGKQRRVAWAVSNFMSPESEDMARLMRQVGDAPTEKEVIEILNKQAPDMVRRLQVGSETKKLANLQAKAIKARAAAEIAVETAKGNKRLAKAAEDAVKAADEATALADNAAKELKASKKLVAGDYNIFSYTASSKASILGRDMTLVISSLLTAEGPAGAMRVLQDMRALYGKSANEAMKIAAWKRLATKKGMAGMLVSKAGRITGAALDILDENVIGNIIENYGNQPLELSRQLFSKLDGVLRDVFPSVDEMEDAVKAVKDGSIDARNLKLAAQYDLVPDYIKTSHKAFLRKANKIHGANIRTQSLVYMGWSPGYAVRNLTGQTTLMAMNFGISEAVEMTTKAAAAGITDKKTATFIGKMAEDMAKANIPIPDEMWKGVADAPSLKPQAADIRKFAQNSEKATSSAIIHKHALKEVRKLGRKLAEGMADGLKRAGFEDAAVKRLLSNLDNANYNETDAVVEWRKSLDGEWIDEWRSEPLPEMLRDYLSQGLKLDEVQALQKNAQSPEEFMAGIDKVMADIEKGTVDTAVLDEAAFSDSVHKAAPELVAFDVEVQRAIDAGEIDVPRALENEFTGMVTGYQNARNQLDIVVQRVQAKINQMAGSGQVTQDVAARLNRQVEQAHEWWFGGKTPGKYQRTVYVNEKVTELVGRARKGEDITKLWNEARVGGVFSISDIYPDVDPATLSPRQFISHMYEGRLFWMQDFWMKGNQRYMGFQMRAVEEALTTSGSSMAEFAAQNAQGLNPLTEYKKAVDYAERWSQGGALNPKLKEMLRAHPPERTIGELTKNGDESVFTILEENAKKVLNQVNKDRRAAGLAEYPVVGDVPVRDAVNSVLKRKAPNIPPPYDGGNPSFARCWWESLPALKKELRGWAENVSDTWGNVSKVDNLTPEAEAALETVLTDYREKMKYVRTKAAIEAVGIRDMLLFDYQKTYLDVAFSYVKPFGYWTNNAYVSTFELMASNPKYANWYMSLKEYQAKQHADKPDWYKQMVGMDVPGLGGVFFNIEQNLNPVYSLVGTDFNDPKRRVDFLTSAVDDIGKIGGANNTLINWAVAAYLYNKGEKEAGRRWLGRALPQTNVLKAVLNADLVDDKNLLDILGIKDIPEDSPLKGLRYGELDPLVLMQGGMDAYEEGRANNQLAQWVDEGATEQERLQRQQQAIDAAASRSGPLWDMAVERAIDMRAPGNVIGFMGGPGFKMRTEADAKIEAFYNKYYQLMALKSTMSGDQYRQAWDVLREENPFMDTLLIGRMAGQDRDEALAYNVLGRLPPGSLADIATEAGIPNELISAFYENKGFEGWSDSDRENFTRSILDLSAMLAIPDTATRREWTQVKNTWDNMNSEMERRFGADIREKINQYYTSEDGQGYLQKHPDVQAAMGFQNAMVVNNPLLAQYYGGISQIERYYFSKVYSQLDAEYPNMDKYMQLWNDLNMQGRSKEAKAVYKEYHIADYLERLSAYKSVASKHIISMAAKLPDVELNVREDFTPAGIVQRQMAASITQPSQTFEDLTADMPDILKDNVLDYLQSGKALNYTSRQKLDYLAKNAGFAGWEEYIRFLGISLNR